MNSPVRLTYRVFRLFLPTIIIFMMTGTHEVFCQNKKEDLQKTKKQLEQEIKYTNTLLEQTQKSKQASLNRLVIIDKQIEKREALVVAINTEIDGIQNEIALQTAEVDQLSGELKKMKDEYASMIYFAYKNLNIFNRIMFIFAAEDFNQAYHRLRYYQQYSAYRRTQAQLIAKTQKELAQKINNLQQTREQKTVLAQSKEQEKEKLITEKVVKNQTVTELSKKEKQLAATLKEKQATAQKLQHEIEKLISEEIRASAVRAKKAAKTESKTTPKAEMTESKIMLTPVEMQLSSSFAANKGKLPWPSEKGIVTGFFGEHAHPVLKYVKVKNNGIDITTDKDAIVRSVFNGKVSRVMSFPNMNTVVIIRHGEFLTVYSNLEDVTVSDGQEINTKQAIGRVHTSEEDAKTEYHFEIWLGKTIQNPQEWLAAHH